MSFKTLLTGFFIVLLGCSVSSYGQTLSDSMQQVLNKKTDTEKIEFLNNLAKKNIKTSPEKSIDYANQSLEISKKIKNRNAELNSLLILGKALKRVGKYSESINNFQKALDIYIAANHKEGKAYCYSEIGDLYKNLNQYNNALEDLSNALKLYQELKDNKNTNLTLNSIGNVYSKSQNYQKAIEYYNKVLTQIETSGDNKGITVINSQIGASYANWGNYEEALKYLEKAKKIAETNNYTQLVSTITKNISDIQYNISINEKTTTAFDKEKNAEQQQYLSSLETENLAVKNKNLKSFEEIEKLSFENQAKELKLHVIQENLEKQVLEKKQKEQNIKLLNTNNKLIQAELSKEQDKLKNQKKILFIILSALCIVFVLLVFIFRLFLFKKKSLVLLKSQHQEILIQKKEIETQNENMIMINEELQNKNILIIDSINYAKRIQNAVLPSNEYVNKLLVQSGFNNARFFILFKPKDIVSGDFYWMVKTSDYLFTAVADCTGHGVPGGFMSMIGISLLNEIVKEKNILCPAEILNELNTSIINSLNQTFENSSDSNEIVTDGMEISICRIEPNSHEMQIAVAGQTVFIINNDTIKEIDGTFYSIGDPIIAKRNLAFQKQIITTSNNDIIYMFSDGLSDQFGGQEEQKFMQSNFKNLLLSINTKPLEEQMAIINTTIEKWMSNVNASTQKAYKQTDDITVIGLKIR
ncbi:MAG: hypothetical protein COZ21_01465 [Bacteroidetes bacterium CG_4_10_14_3_um_filter_31_20]|nr:MAG: hypothetical protein COZ21_01465 [Bacteroidetes bacterium CG_4_10_14_3_um_filter_31_20]